MQTVVGRSAGDHIVSTAVVLVDTVTSITINLIGTGGIGGIVHALSRPVLCPGQGSVSIGVLIFDLLVLVVVCSLQGVIGCSNDGI